MHEGRLTGMPTGPIVGAVKQAGKARGAAGADRAGHDSLGTILDCVADGVFTVDTEKRIRFFNRAAEEITGFSAEEAVGRYCREVFRTTNCPAHCTLENVEKTGRNVVNRPVTILTRDGRSLLVSVSAALLADAAGNRIGGVETFRDLSAEEELRREIQKSYTFQDIVSRHPSMQSLFAILPDVAESSATVLLEGESGTGKELFARAIHNLGARKDGPFVAVNSGALPDTLLESELFGYKKGAFTDAKQDKPGRFALAEGGTLFIDEVAEISHALQVRLLRVLQEKIYEPLGGTESISTDARIVAATNRRLLERVRGGKFREDLYYRLNVIRLALPPLRERRSDIPLLVEHFRRLLNAESGKQIDGVDDEVIDLLMRYDFPGNVRELGNILQHAFVLCRESVITRRHLPAELAGEAESGGPGHTPRSLAEIEKQAIRCALADHGGNRTATAKELGIDPSTLYRKMKRYGISG